MNADASASVEAEGVFEAETKQAWQIEVERQLGVLRRDVLGQELDPLRLTALCEEIEVLACVVAWHHERGNITSAAKRRGTSRRIFRERVQIWATRHPEHVPERPRRVLSSAEEEAKRALAREEHNARRRARRAEARAEKAASSTRGRGRATSAKTAGQP